MTSLNSIELNEKQAYELKKEIDKILSTQATKVKKYIIEIIKLNDLSKYLSKDVIAKLSLLSNDSEFFVIPRNLINEFKND